MHINGYVAIWWGYTGVSKVVSGISSTQVFLNIIWHIFYTLVYLPFREETVYDRKWRCESKIPANTTSSLFMTIWYWQPFVEHCNPQKKHIWYFISLFWRPPWDHRILNYKRFYVFPKICDASHCQVPLRHHLGAALWMVRPLSPCGRSRASGSRG